MKPSPKILGDSAVRAALAAGSVLRRGFGKKLKVSEKPGAGLVTNMDMAAEAAALRVLGRRHEGFSLLTEESPPLTTQSPGRWILDPLDGTTNYVHGFPMFCVSIAAEWEGKLVAGVIYHPILNDLYVAILGMGATLNGEKIKVSATRHMRNSLLTTGFTYGKEKWLRREMRSFERLSARARAIRRPGSAALDLAYTARGVFDGFWERRLSPWDIAAGALIVSEAGGKVTDFGGNRFKVDGCEILATNGKIHSGLQKAIGHS